MSEVRRTLVVLALLLAAACSGESPPDGIPVSIETERYAIDVLLHAGARNVSPGEPATVGWACGDYVWFIDAVWGTVDELVRWAGAVVSAGECAV